MMSTRKLAEPGQHAVRTEPGQGPASGTGPNGAKNKRKQTEQECARRLTQ
jgi:hypothetical protein